MSACRKPGATSRAGVQKAMADLRSGGRGGWYWVLGLGVVVVFAVAVIGAVVAFGGGHRTAPGGAQGLNHPPSTLAVGAESMPPWPAPADASGAARAAGLPMARMEGTVQHLHAHLDVLVDGQPTAVPANIGIDTQRGTMSALHTHDGSGLIHIESPLARPFSLGELFTEWQVSLSEDHLGALHAGAGKQIRVLVNGVPRPGNPAAITMAAHDEIAIVFGTPHPGESIPSAYQFPDGQ